jgi:hypothetical protein
VSHGDVRELIAPYALGALERDEMELVREHLAGCAFCANLAREASDVVHLLPYAAPYRPAPEASLDRVMRTIRVEHQRRSSQPTPQGSGSLWDWLRRPIFAPVAAGVLLVLGLAGWNMMLMSELNEDRRQMATLHNRLAQQSHLLLMVTSGSAVTRPLQGTSLAPSAAIRLIMDGETNSAMLMASRLPPPPAGQVYQVWLGRQGARMPAARLTVDDQGDGECTLELDSSVHSYDSAWITLEPARGSPMPSSPGVARGVL